MLETMVKQAFVEYQECRVPITSTQLILNIKYIELILIMIIVRQINNHNYSIVQFHTVVLMVCHKVNNSRENLPSHPKKNSI